jgi:hypothetical protein
MHHLPIRDHLQKRLNLQQTKDYPHPFHDPDPTPSGFFLFDFLKENFRRTFFTMSDDLIFVIRQIFSEIPEMALEHVLTNWITRLS